MLAWNKLTNKVGDADAALRSFFENRATQLPRDQAAWTINEMRGRYPSNAESVNAYVRAQLGDMATLGDRTVAPAEAMAANRVDRNALIAAAALKEAEGNKEAALNRYLSRNDWQGQAARGGLIAAGVGGAVAGGMALTEGAQQLIALMQYMQSGQQNEAAAQDSPLA